MTKVSATIHPFEEENRVECANLLAQLPGWFGIEESNRAYIAALGKFPTALARLEDRLVGFIALEQTSEIAIEIHVLAVAPDLHRQSIGTQLVDWSINFCRKAQAPWLHVKTLGPSEPDEGYARTRAFYRARGFDPLFETNIWDENNPTLVLVQRLDL